MPPGVKPARLLEKGEALSKLDRLAEIMQSIVKRWFKGKDAERTWSFLHRRLEGAREILLHAEERIAGVRKLGNAYIAAFIASKFSGRPVAPRRVIVRTLEGRLAEVRESIPAEAVYHVELGPYAAKCTCPDAIFAGSRADRALMELGFPMQAYRYVPCKHVLALLALLWARGELRPDQPPYNELIERLVVTAYLASLPPSEKPKISRVALVYTRRGETQTPLTLN